MENSTGTSSITLTGTEDAKLYNSRNSKPVLLPAILWMNVYCTDAILLLCPQATVGMTGSKQAGMFQDTGIREEEEGNVRERGDTELD